MDQWASFQLAAMQQHPQPSSGILSHQPYSYSSMLIEQNSLNPKHPSQTQLPAPGSALRPYNVPQTFRSMPPDLFESTTASIQISCDKLIHQLCSDVEILMQQMMKAIDDTKHHLKMTIYSLGKHLHNGATTPVQQVYASSSNTETNPNFPKICYDISWELVKAASGITYELMKGLDFSNQELVRTAKKVARQVAVDLPEVFHRHKAELHLQQVPPSSGSGSCHSQTYAPLSQPVPSRKHPQTAHVVSTAKPLPATQASATQSSSVTQASATQSSSMTKASATQSSSMTPASATQSTSVTQTSVSLSSLVTQASASQSSSMTQASATQSLSMAQASVIQPSLLTQFTHATQSASLTQRSLTTHSSSVTQGSATRPSLVTQACVTQSSSVTQACATQSSVTQACATQSSVPQACATQSSVTQACVTQSSVTQACVTQSSVTQACVTQSSVTQACVTQSSVTHGSSGLSSVALERTMRSTSVTTADGARRTHDVVTMADVTRQAEDVATTAGGSRRVNDVDDDDDDESDSEVSAAFVSNVYQLQAPAPSSISSVTSSCVSPATAPVQRQFRESATNLCVSSGSAATSPLTSAVCAVSMPAQALAERDTTSKTQSRDGAQSLKIMSEATKKHRTASSKEQKTTATEEHKITKLKATKEQKIQSKSTNEREKQHKHSAESGPFQCDECGRVFMHRKSHKLHVMRAHSNERPHQCQFCEKRFVRACECRLHEETHSGKPKYKCSQCPKEFFQKASYEIHVKRRHTDTRQFVCAVCRFGFVRKCDLNEHMKTHAPDKQFVCEFCKRAFLREKTLLQHRALHTGEKMHSCKICAEQFTSVYFLNRHVKLHKTTAKGQFKCHRCPEVFDRTSLQQHVLTAHRTERALKCRTCAAEFANKSELIAHRQRHAEESRFICLNKHCLQSFTTKSALEAHEHTAHALRKPAAPAAAVTSSSNVAKKYTQCEECGESVAKSRLQRHLNAHTDTKPYMCDQCPKQYRVKKSLQVHVIIKHGGVRPFACTLCAKRFPTAYRLTEHQRTHNKDHVCDICDRAYSSGKLLLEHMAVHTGEKLFRCKLCTETFARYAHLLKHCKMEHKRFASGKKT